MRRTLAWSQLTAVLSPLALTVAAALVVTLGLQNRGLRDELAVSRGREILPYPGFLVPAFGTRTITGDSITVGESETGGAQLLFLFASTCPHCRRTLPRWNTIARELKATELPGVTIFGLSKESSDELRLYAAEQDLSFAIGSFPNAKLPELYRVVGAAADSVIQAVLETVQQRS